MRTDARVEFEWLFRSAFPRIKRTVALVLRDHQAAEDVTQEAFLRLHQHWSTVSGYEQMRSRRRFGPSQCGVPLGARSGETSSEGEPSGTSV